MFAKVLPLAALALLFSAGAFAQDAPLSPRRRTPTLLSDRTVCSEVLGMECKPARKIEAPALQAKNSLLTRFTNLAGMFMGRVDAAQSQTFRFRITLELKTPPSSVDNHISWDDD